MKERDFINTINNILQSEYLGDDCAYLKDLGIVVTQDSLVEGVHFLRSISTPYKLGYKSVMVNISDVCASGAEPKYLTIALSLPDDVDEQFVEEFYRGAKDASGDAQIVGGDITSADKIYVSVSAIGSVSGRKISSRSSAKIGQKIIVAGVHGSSGAGLAELMKNPEAESEFVNAHLLPKAQIEFSKNISLNIQEDYAMMDTSDGLMDALSAIALSSGVMLDVDFDKIPHSKELEKFDNWQDLIFFGGEDYGLVATGDKDYGGTVIGEVREGSGVKVRYRDCVKIYTKDDVEKKLFKHFKE